MAVKPTGTCKILRCSTLVGGGHAKDQRLLCRNHWRRVPKYVQEQYLRAVRLGLPTLDLQQQILLLAARRPGQPVEMPLWSL